MALLAKQALSSVGSVPTLAAATGGGDTVAMDGGGTAILVVKNGDASPKTVTVGDARTPLGQTQPGVPLVIAAGATGYIVLDPATANSTGVVAVTYSAVTSVTVGAVRL